MVLVCQPVVVLAMACLLRCVPSTSIFRTSICSFINCFSSAICSSLLCLSCIYLLFLYYNLLFPYLVILQQQFHQITKLLHVTFFLIMPLRTSSHNHQRLTYSCCYFCNRELINCICLINLYPTFAMKYKGFYSTRLNQPTNGLIISIVFNGQTHIILIINAYLYFHTN